MYGILSTCFDGVLPTDLVLVLAGSWLYGPTLPTMAKRFVKEMADKKIGRYIIKGTLGEGAMGCVFKAHDPNLERTVAIKTMRTGHMTKSDNEEEFKNRFFLEARANGRLNHPNIVAVYDSGIMDNDPYLVMEYIEGLSLDNFIGSQGDSYLHAYTELMGQIAAGLDFAHEEGVVHRDIKPGNILVSLLRSGRVRAKLVDFGLAKLKDSKLTQTGYFLGTPSYASPEQVLGGKLDTRSDIFSFGTVAYEMLTGSLPFDAESLHAILYKIANEKPILNFEQFADHVDVHALACVFRTILQKDPEARFQTASDFVEELRPLLSPLKTVKMTHLGEASAAKSQPGLERTSVGPKPSEDLSNSRHQQIREVRLLFQEAFQSKNVSSSKYCLGELERLGADVTEEKGAIDQLNKEIIKERKAKRRAERARLVKKARQAFETALRTRNLESVRFCLNELKKLKADVASESQKVKALEDLLEEEAIEKAKQEKLERQQYILKRQQQLSAALGARDVQRCGILLKELGSLLKVDVSKERAELVRIKNELETQQEVTRTRSAFLDALASKDLKKCRGVVARLQELGADVAEENKGIASLTQQLSHEDRRQFKDRVITRAREAFRDALARKNPDSCNYYLRELKQMSVDVTSEERALASLERMLKEEEANSLKAAMIEKLREEFRKACDHRNMEACQYYIRELTQLKADVEEERALHGKLESTLKAEDELANNMISQVRALFNKAVSDKDAPAAAQHLKVLRGIGADVDREEKALKRLHKKLETDKEQEKLRAKMVAQFRGKFQEGYHKKNRDTCRYYLKELMQLGVDVAEENQLLSAMEVG